MARKLKWKMYKQSKLFYFGSLLGLYSNIFLHSSSGGEPHNLISITVKLPESHLDRSYLSYVA